MSCVGVRSDKSVLSYKKKKYEIHACQISLNFCFHMEPISVLRNILLVTSFPFPFELSYFKLSQRNMKKCHHYNVGEKSLEIIINIYLNSILWKTNSKTLTFTVTVIKISRPGEYKVSFLCGWMFRV